MYNRIEFLREIDTLNLSLSLNYNHIWFISTFLSVLSLFKFFYNFGLNSMLVSAVSKKDRQSQGRSAEELVCVNYCC